LGEGDTVYSVGPADRGKRLDRFLAGRIPSVSRAYLQQAIWTRVALSWGAEPKPSTRVRPGGFVRVGFPALAEEPLEVAVPVLGRGVGWLAVDKPAGLPVHPVNRARANTLLAVLARQEGREGLRLVHRLDRETSGVLLVAEDREAARFLSAEFARGGIRKEYLAVVRGVIQDDHGEIDTPIADSRTSRVSVRREAAGGGQLALTRWQVVRRHPDRTLVLLHPVTGRRHQIRVHLAAIGHSILGDLLYGRSDEAVLGFLREGRDPRETEGLPQRHLLHCARLAFRTPEGREQEVTSPLPPDFARALSDPR